MLQVVCEHLQQTVCLTWLDHYNIRDLKVKVLSALPANHRYQEVTISITFTLPWQNNVAYLLNNF